MDDRQFGFKKQRIQRYFKKQKFLDGFRRREKTAAIYEIKTAYDKINRIRTLEQLENMEIQGRMLRFFRELIGERWIKVRVWESISQSKQTDL